MLVATPHPALLRADANHALSRKGRGHEKRIAGARRIVNDMSFITGVGLTSYGKHEGSSTLDLMSQAAAQALNDSGLKRADVDGVLCGYSTTMPHLMLATVFAEHFGIQPT